MSKATNISESQKVVGVIPARYSSSRLPGKPLVDICGKPMIWWVYQQAKKVKELSEVYIATDDIRVEKICADYGMNVVMTSEKHTTHMHRLHEFAQRFSADAYVCICGDEPLIEPEVIGKIIPSSKSSDEMLVRGVMRELTDPAETVDSGNIKIIARDDGLCLSLSRTPIPYPYKTVKYSFKKTIGIECFNKKAIDFYVDGHPGQWETIEDIMMIRYLENRIPVHFSLVNSQSLSVDTPKDLEKVREIMKNRIKGDT